MWVCHRVLFRLSPLLSEERREERPRAPLLEPAPKVCRLFLHSSTFSLSSLPSFSPIIDSPFLLPLPSPPNSPLLFPPPLSAFPLPPPPLPPSAIPPSYTPPPFLIPSLSSLYRSFSSFSQVPCRRSVVGPPCLPSTTAPALLAPLHRPSVLLCRARRLSPLPRPDRPTAERANRRRPRNCSLACRIKAAQCYRCLFLARDSCFFGLGEGG